MFRMMQGDLFAAPDDEDVSAAKPETVAHEGEISLLIGQAFTLAEAAEKLGCKIRTVQTHVACGDLVAVNVGCGGERKSLRIFEDDLEGFIKRRRVAAVGVAAAPRDRSRPHLGTVARVEPGGFAEGRAARKAARAAKEGRNG